MDMSHIQNDIRTFPREDPAVAAARAKQDAATEKARKAEETANRKIVKAAASKKKELEQLPTPDETKSAEKQRRDRELKLLKIRLYFSKLKHKLPNIKEPATYPRNDEDIDALLLSIESTLQSNGGIEYASNMFVSGCGIVEQVSRVYNPTGLRLTGPNISLTQAAVASQKDWSDLVAEFAISNAEWFMMGPGKRLLVFGYQLVTQVDHLNHKARETAPPPATVSTEEQDAAAHL